jgi:hypothetical protein
LIPFLLLVEIKDSLQQFYSMGVRLGGQHIGNQGHKCLLNFVKHVVDALRVHARFKFVQHLGVERMIGFARLAFLMVMLVSKKYCRAAQTCQNSRLFEH